MTDKSDFLLMSEIANRGIKMMTNLDLIGGVGYKIKKLDLMMDLEYANDETPIDFEKLLAFDDDNFAHDIIGIYENFNRDTLTMDNCFSPRSTLHVEDRVNSKLQGLSKAVANEVKVLPGLTVTEV